MRHNLDSLRSEIQEYLESRDMIVFHSHPRSTESSASVYWDTTRHPDYKMFLAAAEAAGARIVTLYAREFTADYLDDALEQVRASSMGQSERRVIESRLREIGSYAGFTCQIELSFDIASRVYTFDLRTDWFEDFDDLLDQIDHAAGGREEDKPLGGGGYFSKN